MQGGEVADIVRRAEHLLWVLARCDVEDLQSTRHMALIELSDLENQAAQFRTSDLYREVIENTVLNQ